MASLRELLELTRVRVLLFLREPEALFWVFVFPIVMAGVLGFAFRGGEPPDSRVLVLQAPDAQQLVERLSGPGLEVELAPDAAQAERELRKGRADVLVEVGAPPRLRFDPARQEALVARLRVEAALRGPSAQPIGELVPEEDIGSRYVDFLFPGLLGMNLMGTGLWSIGFAIAELRQRKLLRRLLVTPMRRSNFLASFLLARLVFLAGELAALAGFGAWVLDVPMRGSLFAFAFASLLGAISFAGIGLLAASRVRTIQGASGVLNLVMMPMWLCSGVFFSYERFPEFLHPLLRLIPLTALNDALRALMLDGDTLASQATPLLVLATWGVVSFLLAVRVFRWE
ncbi:MAG TPA: ABC transporter permease [Planctomycetota bacterium]|nr:ABC transporter permease [Planctomycetota bacterium]